jgi:hypothetical protein
MSRFLLCALSMLALVLVACGETAGRSQVPERSASDLATVRALSGSPAATSTRRSSTPTATARPVQPSPTPTTDLSGPAATHQQILDVMLTRSDLPPRWTISREEVSAGALYFCDLDDIDIVFESRGYGAGYYTATNAQWLTQYVSWLTEETAPAAMDYIRQNFDCDEETYTTSDGYTIRATYGDLDVPTLGDESFARTFTFTFEDRSFSPVSGAVIYIRSGELVSAIYHEGYYFDSNDFTQIVAAAAARLATFSGGNVGLAPSVAPSRSAMRHL